MGVVLGGVVQSENLGEMAVGRSSLTKIKQRPSQCKVAFQQKSGIVLLLGQRQQLLSEIKSGLQLCAQIMS